MLRGMPREEVVFEFDGGCLLALMGCVVCGCVLWLWLCACSKHTWGHAGWLSMQWFAGPSAKAQLPGPSCVLSCQGGFASRDCFHCLQDGSIEPWFWMDLIVFKS